MQDLGIIWLDGGKSHTGTDRPEIKADGESPIRKVTLRPFGMMETAVTAEQFSRFVAETGYQTHAEEYGWSYVFKGLMREDGVGIAAGTPWWVAIEGSSWAAPFGPKSSWQDAPDHPATHITHRDAAAFAKWAGGRLPSEAEWEFAARGGTAAQRYPWGEDEPDDETVFCNIWQGKFPNENTEKDGYYATAPAKSFAPNALGFYNMSGNVWEWCAERFKVKSVSKAAKIRNARAAEQNEYVAKGGSYMCHRSYCWRYRIAARTGLNWESSAGHTGLRIAFDSP